VISIEICDSYENLSEKPGVSESQESLIKPIVQPLSQENIVNINKNDEYSPASILERTKSIQLIQEKPYMGNDISKLILDNSIDDILYDDLIDYSLNIESLENNYKSMKQNIWNDDDDDKTN
jgi:vacuolar-type H+-ATPase subunit E/Vma4